MNKLLKLICGVSAAAILFAAPSLRADSGASDGKDGKSVRGKSLEERVRELEEKLKDVGYTGVKGSGIKVSGYVDTSYIVNLRGDDGSDPNPGALSGGFTGNGTSSTYGNARVFDAQHDEFVLNSVKLTLEKAKDDSDFPAGFRVDLMYGSDANILNNRSYASINRDSQENDSDFFLEQAYVDMGLPLGSGVDVKIGKMVTVIGYEVIESPANANFSRSFAFNLAPTTQTGVIFGYNVNDNLALTAGVINGINNDGSQGFGTFTGVNGAAHENTEWVGVYQVAVKSPEWSFGTFNFNVSGLFGNGSPANTFSVGGGDNFTTTYDNSAGVTITDVTGTWAKVGGIDALSLGFEVFMESQENVRAFANGAPLTSREDNSQDDLVAALYAKYQITDWFYVAARGEYWDADARSAFGNGIYNRNNAFDPALGANSGGTDSISVWEGTLTAGFTVWKDTLVRLEWRHDEVAGHENGFINNQSLTTTGAPQIRSGQDTIAVNVAYSF